METSLCLPQRRAQLGRLGQTLLLTTFAATCSAEAGGSDSASAEKHSADFSVVLRYVTYLLIGLSSIQLVISAAAVLRMPKPRCLCYSVPYSDIATCFGILCCPCANIRQLSATMILVWSVLLMCQLSIGMHHLFLYPYLGFCALHVATFVVVHVLIRGYQRNELLIEAANQHHTSAALRLAMTTGPGASSRRRAAAAAAPQLPTIQTMSAELVMVLQPDYGCYYYSTDGGGEGGGGGGGLQRCSSTSAGLGQRRGGGGAVGSDDVAVTRGGGGGGGGGLEKGIAWALRYTRTVEHVSQQPPASPCKVAATTAAVLGFGGAEAPSAAEGSVGGGGERLVGQADASTRSAFGGSTAAAAVAAAAAAATEPAAAALWRTGSEHLVAWSTATPFASSWVTAAAAAAAPTSPVAGGGGGQFSGVLRTCASAGLPLRQASGGAAGAAPLTPCSSPSYGRIFGGTLSKRSSPVSSLPPPPSPYLLLPPPPPPSPQLRLGGSPRCSTHRQTSHHHPHPHPQHPSMQLHPLHHPHHQQYPHPQQLAVSPRPPSSSSSLCSGTSPRGGSPPPSRLGLRVDTPLPPVSLNSPPVLNPAPPVTGGTGSGTVALTLSSVSFEPGPGSCSGPAAERPNEPQQRLL